MKKVIISMLFVSVLTNNLFAGKSVEPLIAKKNTMAIGNSHQPFIKKTILTIKSNKVVKIPFEECMTVDTPICNGSTVVATVRITYCAPTTGELVDVSWDMLHCN